MRKTERKEEMKLIERQSSIFSDFDRDGRMRVSCFWGFEESLRMESERDLRWFSGGSMMVQGLFKLYYTTMGDSITLKCRF
jgi:hypothetical protein